MNTQYTTEARNLAESNEKESTEISVNNTSPSNRKRNFLLLNNVKLILQSQVAVYYFHKGGKPQGTGVYHFIKSIRVLWQAIVQDDPYADLFLLNTHQLLVDAKSSIQERIKHYQTHIQANTQLEWQLASSEKPTRIQFHCGLPYGGMAASLIIDFDKFVCLLNSAKMLGVVLDKSINTLLEAEGEKIRSALNLPSTWHQTHVTRQDVKEQTDKGKEAYKLMGALPERVLLGETRAFYAPKIKKHVAAN